MSEFTVEALAKPVIEDLAAMETNLTTGFSKAISDTKRAVQTTVRNEFQTAGEGDWRPITPRTLKGRRVNTAPGAINQPLIDTGELMVSITQDGAKHQILTETPTELALGTDRVDALRHQFGSADGAEPARPFLFISDKEQASIERIFSDDLDQRLSRVIRR